MATVDDHLKRAVARARNELSAMIDALTNVLMAVAESKPAANGQPEEQGHGHSLAEVLKRVEALRDAVDEATRAGKGRQRASTLQEEGVLSTQREALVRRRYILMQEVAQKNEKVKILIDDLRELHRDIAILLSVFNPMKVQPRVR